MMPPTPAPQTPASAAPNASTESPSPTKSDILYPSIDFFLDLHDEKEPLRYLLKYKAGFAAHDVFTIVEIVKIGREGLITHIGMSLGNAEYLLSAAKKEVKMIEKRAHRTNFDE